MKGQQIRGFYICTNSQLLWVGMNERIKNGQAIICKHSTPVNANKEARRKIEKEGRKLLNSVRRPLSPELWPSAIKVEDCLVL
jgi:hypothetical protein